MHKYCIYSGKLRVGKVFKKWAYGLGTELGLLANSMAPRFTYRIHSISKFPRDIVVNILIKTYGELFDSIICLSRVGAAKPRVVRRSHLKYTIYCPLLQALWCRTVWTWVRLT